MVSVGLATASITKVVMAGWPTAYGLRSVPLPLANGPKSHCKGYTTRQLGVTR